MTRLELDLEWRTSLLTALLFPALIGLGLWQLDRAAEKEALQARNAARASAAAVALDTLGDWSPDALADRRVALRGTYLQEPLLFLDNRIRAGRYGHDVVSVFVDQGSQLAVLLNRGWIAGDPSRRSLPSVATPGETLSLEAKIYVSPGDPYVLASEAYDALEPVMLVQQNNTPELRRAIEDATGYTLFPRELRLAPASPSGFRRDWPVVNQTAQKHRGYALQWFTMAAVLALIFLLRSSNIAALIRPGRSNDGAIAVATGDSPGDATTDRTSETSPNATTERPNRKS